MNDHQKPFFADLILAYNLCGEREALLLLKEFWQEVEACVKDGQGVPPGIHAVMKTITIETDSAWVEGR